MLGAEAAAEKCSPQLMRVGVIISIALSYIYGCGDLYVYSRRVLY